MILSDQKNNKNDEIDSNEKILRDDNERIKRLIDNMTLYEDALMSRVFDQNIEATELMLRIILNRKIEVVRVNGQKEIKNSAVDGRNIVLDILARESSGELINIEVQSNSRGAHVRRARFHSSMIDTRMLKEKESFRQLKDSYVIFMYKRDKFGQKLPLYHIDRMVLETGKNFRDGSHIIYVNGAYKGDNELGHLIADFHCKKAEKFFYNELAKSVKHFKNAEKGLESMSDSVEKYGNDRERRGIAKGKAEGEFQATLRLVYNLMENLRCSLEQAMNILGIKDEERKTIAEKLENCKI